MTQCLRPAALSVVQDFRLGGGDRWSGRPAGSCTLDRRRFTLGHGMIEDSEGAQAGVVLRDELEALHAASFAWAVRCCHGDRDEARDVLQQTYLKILEGRARFDGRSSLKTWLFAVIRYTRLEWRRRGLAWTRHLRRLHDDSAYSRSASPDPEKRHGRAERAERLRRALAALSRRQQEVLHLVFYEDMTIAEAAAVLAISVGSARTHYDRGKRTLRAQLAEMER